MLKIQLITSQFFYSKFLFSLKEINSEINKNCGIINFFDNELEWSDFKRNFYDLENAEIQNNRVEYGDFQTPLNFAVSVINLIKNKNIEPEIIIEPTCGKGNFIVAALSIYHNIRQIYGFEINKTYCLESKINILNYFLENKINNIPEIRIFHENIFDFDFNILNINKKGILIIGNPPWVTNTDLSKLNSNNLPSKTNFKQVNGIDAITGKGNFDISENICLLIIRQFEQFDTHFAFLIKNAVIKNLLYEQNKLKYKINSIENYRFDSKKEFNVNVAASLFCCQLGGSVDFVCREYDFYQANNCIKTFGWTNQKFVADISKYADYQQFDGKSPFEWRQGIKHDCSKIMELKKIENKYLNQLGDEFILEEDLIYGWLKSSDLQRDFVSETHRFIIIPQKKVGENTDYLKDEFPNIFHYLNHNIHYFNSRKSSIYRNKPAFSIFGVGDYSFKPYKIAISGFYSRTLFTLIKPFQNKSMQLDDTCYFIGFEQENYAIFTLAILNHKITQNLLHSIIFSDAKRMITKELLMRINLKSIANEIYFHEINKFCIRYSYQCAEKEWIEYLSSY